MAALAHFILPTVALTLIGCSQPDPAKPVASKPESVTSPASQAATPPATSGTLDWQVLERPLLTNHIQITSREKFYKAGEAYFDHQTPPRWVIFQAVAVPPAGKEPEAFYAMYVAKLTRDAGGRIVGTEEPVKISPDGSANTCGWFHPIEPWRVLFGSTLTAPANNEKSGFQVGTRKYVWMFPSEMEVVTYLVPAIMREYPKLRETVEKWERISTERKALAKQLQNAPLKEQVERLAAFNADPNNKISSFAWVQPYPRPNYDAECSYSKDGRFILYAHVRDEPTRGRPDADIWVYDTKTSEQHEIVHGEGYDGGPFFSPDNTMICYRSDRRGDDLLQLFVAKLKFNEFGVPVGIASEHQVTDDEHVNWAPFWHPSGKFLIYGSSGVAHSNYEVFAVEVDLTKPATELRKRRVTFSGGADVLPVFSDDGKLMMWTAQRGPMVGDEGKPSSQLWIAEVNPTPGGFSDPAHLFDNLPDQRPEGPASAAPPAHP